MIARVFNLKKTHMLKDNPDGIIFGYVKAHNYTIELKRGLPQCHMLFILANENETWQNVDNVICAELQDPTKFHRLYSIVKRYMIHCPCCIEFNLQLFMQQGFPKIFCSQTTTGDDAYPISRRISPANGGQRTLSTIRPGGEIAEADNRFVVSYNPSSQ